jgi:hypothetical protein
MFNKSLKKKVAVLLTGVMVLGMSVTAFAKTGTAVESDGAGNFEGHVNRKVVDVTLPTVSANTTPFSFIYDAEGLLKETTAAYGAGYTFTGDNVYFKTADKTFGKQSQKFTVSNNSSVSVNITLKVAVTPGEKDPALVAEASLPNSYNPSTNPVSGAPSLYLGLVVDGDATAAGDAKGTYVVSGNGVEKTFNVDGVPGNYTVSINEVGETSYPHEYEFKIKDSGLAPWKAIDFQLEGAANIVENAKDMTAPDLKVTWNYEGDDGDEGGSSSTPVEAYAVFTQNNFWVGTADGVGIEGLDSVSKVTKFTINDVDVLSKATVQSEFLKVTWADASSLGLQAASSFTIKATVSGVDYAVTFAP